MVPIKPCSGGTRIEGVPVGVEVQFGANQIIARICRHP
jgi:hypothetical protein